MPHPNDLEPLLAFAEMRLDRWSGLPTYSAADADRILGPGGPAQSGSLGVFRHHPGRAPTPLGVLVWLAGDRVSLVGAYGPALPALEPLLGAPEHVAPSNVFAPSHEQWIYASRGLVAHVDRWASRVSRVYGFPAMTVDEFLQSAVAAVEVTETPR
jgi:hypothetical protein